MTLLVRSLPWLTALAMSLPVVAIAQGAPAASQPAPGHAAATQAQARRLQDHVWTLQSAEDASAQPIEALKAGGAAFVLRFDAKRLSVTGGCNPMNGGWRLRSTGRLTVSRMASTMKACEPALMQADQALAALLSGPLVVRSEPGTAPLLQMVTADRQTLRWAGQPTLESQYGAPTRIFLEVAAQTVPCQPGAGAPAQCLQVRERRFDDKGLRIDPPGEWRSFADRIEGYTHTPGVRNVLRIQRYQRSAAPADGSAYVHVLDLVVESEVVKP